MNEKTTSKSAYPNNIKVIDLAREGTLLPAPKGTCPECAVAHDPAQPHNQQSIFWQYKFYNEHGRWPTWFDSMSHCTQEVKEFWIAELAKHGIKVEGDDKLESR